MRVLKILWRSVKKKIFPCFAVGVVLLITAAVVVLGVWYQTNPTTIHYAALPIRYAEIRGSSSKESTPLRADEELLVNFFRKNGIKAEKGLSEQKLADLIDYEKWLLSTSPFTNMASLPNENTSKVIVLTPPDQHSVGSKLQVRVDLYDERERRRKSGGDEVRIWLTHPQSTSKNRTAVAAHVTDLHNGSYLGETTLQWAGVTLLQVSLTYPREFLRLVTTVHHTVLSMVFVTAKFKNKATNISERTVCLHSPIPDFARTCNLTRENGGFPWYCGQPTNANLTCSDLAGVSNLPYTPLPLSDEEKKLQDKMDGEPYFHLIPHNFALTVTDHGENRNKEELPPCSALPPQDSWKPKAHWGWFDQGSWRPSTCSLPEVTEERVQKCMRNTSLLLVGDSNQRILWNMIRDMAGGCSYVENQTCWYSSRICEVVIKYSYTCVRRPPKGLAESGRLIQVVALYRIDHLNGTLRFGVHALPFASRSAGDFYYIPLLDYFRLLPRRHTIVIVIHYYAHTTYDTLHSYRERVRQARKIIATFLEEQDHDQGHNFQNESTNKWQGQNVPGYDAEDQQGKQTQETKDQQGHKVQGQATKKRQGQNVQSQGRKVKVKVFIRGPHAWFGPDRSHITVGDRFAHQLIRIWKEELWDLYDRVWFLDFWDMTIASENMGVHPPGSTLREKLKVLFGYFCEEDETVTSTARNQNSSS